MSSWKRSVCGLAAAGRCATRIALGSCGASGERGTADTAERSIFVLSCPLRNQTVLSNRKSRRWHLFPPKKPVWGDGRQCAGGEVLVLSSI